MEIKLLPRSPETDEVLRLIGRNVLNLQYVEHLLKRLAALHVPTGPASKMEGRIAQHAAAVNGSTMGTLAGKVMDTVLLSPVDKAVPDDIDEPWFGFRFSIGVDVEFVERHDREMRALVETRNELIHNFLPKWHSAAGGDTACAIEYLDAQHAEVMHMMERLKGWVTSAEAGCKESLAYLASPQAGAQFELEWLRSSRLVAMLDEIATRTAREDGWAFFTTAANLILREAPDELVDLEKRFGLKTLKDVLLATGWFDVADETLDNGRVRTIYRINSTCDH